MTIEALESDFEERLDQCWLSVMVADVIQLGNTSGWVGVSRDVRAGAVVMAVAEFEALLKESVEFLNSSIETAGLGMNELREGIRMLHLRSKFQVAASESSLDAAWAARAEIGGAHTASGAVSLPRRNLRGFIDPVGNNTPRAATLTRVWNIYGLPGQPFPSFHWRKSLGELADIRNDVAHRRVKIKEALAGKDRTADAVGQHLLNLRDLGRNFTHMVDQYLVGEQYRDRS